MQFVFLKDVPIRYLIKPCRLAREILEIVNKAPLCLDGKDLKKVKYR